MIHLDIEPYCHECPHFDPRKDATYTHDQWGGTIAQDNKVWCYNSVRCESIARYLRSKLAEEKKMIEIKSYSEYLDGCEPSDVTKRLYIKYLQKIVQSVNERVNLEQSRMTRDELRAMETISDIFEKMAEEEND